MKISAGEFKAKCLKLMDQVKQYHQVIVITKFGKPVAKLVPVDEPDFKKPLFGFLKGTVQIKGDLIAPTGEKWSVDE